MALAPQPDTSAGRRGGWAHATGRQRFSAGCALSLLTACAAAPEPVHDMAVASGPGARLSMRGVALLQGDVFEVSLFRDGGSCLDRRVIGSGTLGLDPAAVTIPAGAALTIEIYVASRSSLFANFQAPVPRQAFCRRRVTFTPFAGKPYLATAFSNGSIFRCGAQLLDVSDIDNPRAPQGAVDRMGQGQGCLPMTASRPLSDPRPEETSDGVAVLNPFASEAPLRNLIQP